MKFLRRLQAPAILLLGVSSPAMAQQSSEIDELAGTYGDTVEVSIATGTRQKIRNAPSSASVITAKDIEAMGATDLMEALESVVGLHVSTASLTLIPRIFIRGIGSEFNPEVLILVNGNKINTQFHGNPSLAFGSFPLSNVARIEIIRGPGSALYGADAFSGVINIITKSAEEIDGLEVGARTGKFNTKTTWLQYGGKLGPIKTSAFIHYNKTDGYKKIIQSDLASVLDGIFNTRTSLAPGPVNAAKEEFDARVDFSLKNWRLRLGFQDRKLATGGGLAEALDPTGRFPETRFNADLSYEKENILPFLNISAHYSYYDLVEKVGDPAYHLFPPGAFGGLFPDGIIGNPGHSEDHHRFGFAALYTGFANHKIRVGAGHEIEDLYKVEEYKNFTFVNGAPVPLPGGVVNATGIRGLVYLFPHKRKLSYAFAQDEWAVGKDWTVTAGIRYDRYSDFGSTTNPRVGLVYDAGYNLIFKALHGRAFRAPSFAEQYNENSPVANGFAGIKPEKIKTTEFVISYQPKPSIQTSLTLYHYKQSNIIAFVATPTSNGVATAANTGNQTGRGAELEVTWSANRNLTFTGNYSYQRSKDETSGKDAGLAPQHRLFVRSNWRFAPNWQFGTTANYVSDRDRQPGDPRTFTVPDYTTVDISLRREKLWKNWEFQVAVKNLLDRDVFEPTLSPGNIRFDLPLAGRSFYAQMIYKF